jgi:hypothetical protein
MFSIYTTIATASTAVRSYIYALALAYHTYTYALHCLPPGPVKAGRADIDPERQSPRDCPADCDQTRDDRSPALHDAQKSKPSEPTVCLPCTAASASAHVHAIQPFAVSRGASTAQHVDVDHAHNAEYYMASPLVCPRLMTLPDAGDRARFSFDSPASVYDGAERSRSISHADEGISQHVHVAMHPAFRFESDPTDTVANAFERLPNSGRAKATEQLKAVVSNLKHFDLDDEAQQVRGRGSLVKWRTRSYNDEGAKEDKDSMGAAAS